MLNSRQRNHKGEDLNMMQIKTGKPLVGMIRNTCSNDRRSVEFRAVTTVCTEA
jgi:hypothetical protein